MKMVQIIKKYKIFFAFILLFGLVFVYSYFILGLFSDEIWNYGFADSIAKGLVPYRDFNMVIPCFFPMCVSFFIVIFGHHLYALHIFNSLVVTSIIFIMYWKMGNQSFIIFPIVLLYAYPNYNIFCVFLFILLLFINDMKLKNKDVWLGFLVSVIFLTKQTVGFCLLIPLLFFAKRKIRCMIAFVIPIFLFVFYLVMNGAFLHFVDYCFLGLFEFGSNNKLFPPLYVILEFILLLVMFVYSIKLKFHDSSLFYVLMFQVMVFPIVDNYHFMIGFIPVLYYFLSTRRIAGYKIKYYCIISLFFCVCWTLSLVDYADYHLYSDKNSFLYGRFVPEYIEEQITDISNYVIRKEEEYDRIYFLNANAYYIKLNIDYEIDKFDLINNGNMGYHGYLRYMDEIERNCARNYCMFVLYRHEYGTQTNEKIISYIKREYQKVEEVAFFDIYSSKQV